MTRSDGSNASGLHGSDLRVFDDGKAQTILSLEPMDRGSATAQGEPGTARPTESPDRNSYPHSVIILLDALNTEWSDQVFAHRAVEHLLDAPSSGERIAIFALGDRLYLVHDFTSDIAELRAALHKLSVKAPHADTAAASPSPYSAAVSFSSLAAFSNSMHTHDHVTDFEARFFQRRRILSSFEALTAIANLAKKIPGQKDLLWVSSAFPLLIHGTTDPLDNDSYFDQAKEATQILSSAGLRVYPVDARGLSASPNAYINIMTMQEFADQTGGKAFYNNNDLTSLMRSALEDSRKGYLLTYSPNDLRADGSFHAIRIKTVHGGVKLRYRLGYFADALPKNRH